MYLFFPLIFWSEIFTDRVVLDDGVKEFLKGISIPKRIILVSAIILVYESIVYAFFDRWIFSLIFNMLSFYPLICGYRDWKRNTLWFITGAAISVFTLLDAVKIESLTQINIASGLIVLTALSGFLHLRKQLNSYTTTVFILSLIHI